MRRLMAMAFVIFMLLSFNSVHAKLVDNGNNLIYDDVRNITWYNPSVGALSWYQATSWITTLNESNIWGVTGWRLPTTLPAYGYNDNSNVLSSELGYLYYTELGNIADSQNKLLLSAGPFDNLSSVNYWTSTIDPKFSGKAFAFDFSDGNQGAAFKNLYIDYSALAIYDGNISVVSEPGIFLLLVPSLAGLAIMRKKFIAHR